MFFYSVTMLVLFLLVACWLAVTIIWLADFFYSIKVGVPSLSSGRNVLKNFFKNIDLSDKKVFYDLGCGNGKFISNVAEFYPQLNCFGLDLNPSGLLITKMRNIFQKNKVDYQNEDFFKINLTEADVVYLYLYSKIVEKLEEKFMRELKPGSMVISNCFKLKNKQADTVFKGSGKLNTLYVYKY